MTIYKQAEIQKRAFVVTVKRFNAVAKESGSMQMDTTADYSWSHVLSAQDSFSQECENGTSRGVKGIVYKQLRRFGDNSEIFQSWLKLLPTESHYLSVLCGGLTLILGVGPPRQMTSFDLQVLTFLRLHNKCLRSAKMSETSSMISH